MIFFLLCVFIMCSCHKEEEEKPVQPTYNIIFINNGHGKLPDDLTNQTHLPNPLPYLEEDGWVFKDWYKDSETFEDRAMPNG